MLIKQAPRIIAIEQESGYYTEDVFDFWRPNNHAMAIVDGKYSTKIYLQSLKHAWQDFTDKTGKEFSDIDNFCYHIPFSRMTEKAHKILVKKTNQVITEKEFINQTCPGQKYNRVVGNSYGASLYIGFCSFLDNADHSLEGERFGFFSYGSGSVAEYFTGIIQKDYQKHIMTTSHQNQINNRQSLNYAEYVDFYYKQPLSGDNITFSDNNKGQYRLDKIENNIRKYEKKS